MQYNYRVVLCIIHQRLLAVVQSLQQVLVLVLVKVQLLLLLHPNYLALQSLAVLLESQQLLVFDD